MTEQDIKVVVTEYVEYYNTCEDCCWTYEKAYKRIHQIYTMEDSMCIVQTEEDGSITGFLMGYYREYDDLIGYYLDEIVIFNGHQGQHLGTELIEHLEGLVKEAGASMIELNSVNDEHHKHFYGKLGFYKAGNFVQMGKFLE